MKSNHFGTLTSTVIKQEPMGYFKPRDRGGQTQYTNNKVGRYQREDKITSRKPKQELTKPKQHKKQRMLQIWENVGRNLF